MAATSSLMARATVCGPPCLRPSKLPLNLQLNESLFVPSFQRGHVGFVEKARHIEAAGGRLSTPRASSDVSSTAAVGEAEAPDSNASSGSNVRRRFKSKEVWRKDPAKVTYLDTQNTRFAFINEVRYNSDLTAVFKKYGNLDLSEIVHALYRLQERRDGRAAMKLVDYLESNPHYSGQLDEATYRAALGALSTLSMSTERATQLFEAAKARGLVRKLDTYNVYLLILSQKGAIDAMEEVLKQMEQAGVRRTVDTWNYLIQGYGRKKDLDGAVVAFTELQAARLTPNAETHRFLLEAFSNSNRTEDGERMIRESGIKMTDVQYNAIMDGYAKEKRPEKVGEILKEAQAAGVEPNSETFLILLKTFTIVGDAKGAWETYRALRSAGHQASVYAFQLLANARRKDKRLLGVRVRHVIELLDTIGESGIRVKEVFDRRAWMNRWILPEVKGVLRGLQRDKKPDLAEQVIAWCYSRPEDDRMQPDEETLAILIQAYGAAGRADDAWKTYQSLGKGRATHITPGKQAFGSLVQALVGAGDLERAENILEESEQNTGDWPKADTYSYYAIMRHYAEKGDAEKVQALFDRAIAAEVSPNPITFMTLLMAYDAAGQSEKAIEIYEAQGPSHLVKLSEGDVRRVTGFLQRHGRADDAKKVQQTYKTKSQAPKPPSVPKPVKPLAPELETADSEGKAKIMAGILTENMRAPERRRVTEALVSAGHLKDEADFVRVAEALMDRRLKQSGDRVVELVPYLQKLGLRFPADAWARLVRRADRAMQAASMFYAAKREAGPDWDDSDAAAALADARKVAGKPVWDNHLVWCVTKLKLSVEETLNPRLWPKGFSVTELSGGFFALRRLGREDEAAALAARIKEVAPELDLERVEERAKEAAGVSEEAADGSEETAAKSEEAADRSEEGADGSEAGAVGEVAKVPS